MWPKKGSDGSTPNRKVIKHKSGFHVLDLAAQLSTGSRRFMTVFGYDRPVVIRSCCKSATPLHATV